MRKVLAVLLLLTVIASGCASQNPPDRSSPVENRNQTEMNQSQESVNQSPAESAEKINFSRYEVDGEFRIVEENRTEYLLYREGEKLYAIPYFDELRPSVEWLAENTPDDARIAVWWDYSHIVKGIADREVIADGPSEKALETVRGDNDWDNWGGLDSNKELKDLATIFAGSKEESLDILRSRGMDYLLMSKQDIKKYGAISKVSGDEDYRRITTFECDRRCPPENKSSSTFKPAYGSSELMVGADVGDEGLKSLTTSGRIEAVKCSESNDENCFFYSFGNLFYVPESEAESMIVQLLSNDVEGLEEVYSSSDAKIWKVK